MWLWKAKVLVILSTFQPSLNAVPFSTVVQFPRWSSKYGPCCMLKNEEPMNSGTVVQTSREDTWSQVSANCTDV